MLFFLHCQMIIKQKTVFQHIKYLIKTNKYVFFTKTNNKHTLTIQY